MLGSRNDQNLFDAMAGLKAATRPEDHRHRIGR
jgi:hypothetical protein